MTQFEKMMTPRASQSYLDQCLEDLWHGENTLEEIREQLNSCDVDSYGARYYLGKLRDQARMLRKLRYEIAQIKKDISK